MKSDFYGSHKQDYVNDGSNEFPSFGFWRDNSLEHDASIKQYRCNEDIDLSENISCQSQLPDMYRHLLLAKLEDYRYPSVDKKQIASYGQRIPY